MRDVLDTHDSLEARREMLAAWLCDWYKRHEAALSQARGVVRVRATGRTFAVTAAQAEFAVQATHDELFRGFEDRPHWGVDERGRPSAMAVAGLATRRLASRLIDRMRVADPEREAVAVETATGEPSHGVEPYDGHDEIGRVEIMTTLRQILAAEPAVTQEIVVRRALNLNAEEIADATGMAPAAVRQRLRRFRVKYHHLAVA